MHPRNRFRDGYDFVALRAGHPTLAPFVVPNAYGDLSIDYADSHAVAALNQALLADAYGLRAWDLPPGGLCPPIPGRSEHLHHLADLLADGASGASGAGSAGSAGNAGVPRGRAVAVLDVGTGASCIYPLIGAREYGWRFVGTEADPASARWAAGLVAAHPQVADRIEVRLQSSRLRCFEGVIEPGERFDLSLCNPPFYASAREAARGNRRKRRNLGGGRKGGDVRNFGGKAGELWCAGGELGFVQRMISESAARPQLCRWFTTLVARGATLPRLRRALDDAGASEVRVLELSHGAKQSRILAWRFGDDPVSTSETRDATSRIDAQEENCILPASGVKGLDDCFGRQR
ncbi:MAG: 23S rRNA (adenine(1618)-N(6))-methyltransferase RlmF [Planctomycetota bacterium]|nr:MAG: 23S rRNA (adenine(1618)-N(6))-methyltransferase RlmF [Planctomycetota bacterium]